MESQIIKGTQRHTGTNLCFRHLDDSHSLWFQVFHPFSLSPVPGLPLQRKCALRILMYHSDFDMYLPVFLSLKYIRQLEMGKWLRKSQPEPNDSSQTSVSITSLNNKSECLNQQLIVLSNLWLEFTVSVVLWYLWITHEVQFFFHLIQIPILANHFF